jgi:hypothetical protein
MLQQLDETIRKKPETKFQEFFLPAFDGNPEDYSTFDAGTLLMLLYGMIVFPWESLKKILRKDKYLKHTNLGDWCNYRILNITPAMQRKPLQLYFVLGLMRNAISHANVKIDEDLEITFRSKEGTVIAFHFKELKKFLSALQTFLNAYVK